MSKQSNKLAYGNKNPISDNDYLGGTNGDTIKKETKSFQVSDLRTYLIAGLSPISGGTIKITEVVYTGVLTTPETVANQLTAQIVLPYEVVIFTVNNDKYQLKKQNVTIGLSQTALVASDFITLTLMARNLAAGISTFKGINATSKRGEHYSIGSVGFSITKELDGGSVETGNILFEPVEQTKLGTGAQFYKGLNTITKRQEFKSLIFDATNTVGQKIINTVTSNASDITILANNIGSKGTLDVTMSIDGKTILIDTPATTSIAGLFVNNDYAPTYNDWLAENKVKNAGTAVSGFLFRGLGTMAQPFTDTRLYTLNAPLTAPTTTANSSIANALLAFVGTGTRLLPQLVGQKIRIQKSTIPYTYSGDFSYSNLYAVLEADVNCTTTDWLVDMDNASYFNALNSTCTIEIAENVTLSIPNSIGFRNSGNTDSTLPIFSTGRTGYLIGLGSIYSSYNGANVLIQYVLNGDGNINNGNLQFQVRCQVKADYEGIYFTKNTQRIDFYNILTSGIFLGSVNLALKAFHMTGGQVRFYDKGAVKIQSETSGRTYGFTFLPTGAGIGNTAFQLNSAKVTATVQYCFARLSNDLVQFLAFNSPSGESFITANPGTSTVINGLFQNLGATIWSISFKNNVFSFTGIDQTKVDLTQGNTVSTSNFIGNNIIESLVTRTGRTSGTQPATDLPVGSVFLNTNNVASPTTGWVRDIKL